MQRSALDFEPQLLLPGQRADRHREKGRVSFDRDVGGCRGRIRRRNGLSARLLCGGAGTALLLVTLVIIVALVVVLATASELLTNT